MASTAAKRTIHLPGAVVPWLYAARHTKYCLQAAMRVGRLLVYPGGPWAPYTWSINPLHYPIKRFMRILSRESALHSLVPGALKYYRAEEEKKAIRMDRLERYQDLQWLKIHRLPWTQRWHQRYSLDGGVENTAIMYFFYFLPWTAYINKPGSSSKAEMREMHYNVRGKKLARLLTGLYVNDINLRPSSGDSWIRSPEGFKDTEVALDGLNFPLAVTDKHINEIINLVLVDLFGAHHASFPTFRDRALITFGPDGLMLCALFLPPRRSMVEAPYLLEDVAGIIARRFYQFASGIYLRLLALTLGLSLWLERREANPEWQLLPATVEYIKSIWNAPLPFINGKKTVKEIAPGQTSSSTLPPTPE